MKVKEIRDLIDFLADSGLEEVNIETEEFKIRVKRSNETQMVEHIASPIVPATPAPAPAAAPTPAPAATEEAPSAGGNYIEVKSPMIGTFYAASNPETPNFVNVGDKIKAGDTLCIIEAMKLFNEIESEVSGTIVKILAQDAQPVEFDQPLFLVDPS